MDHGLYSSNLVISMLWRSFYYVVKETGKRRIQTLKAIFNQLEREDLIEFNPFAKVKLLRQDVDLTTV
ncbi:hypothetical protein D3C76_1478470 [compost metagenome]